MINLRSYTQIILWGANGIEDAGGVNASDKLILFLQKQDMIEKVVCWVDSASRKWGKFLYGKEIFPPEKIKEYPKALVIINTISYLAVQKALEGFGIQNECRIIPFYWYSGTPQFPYDKQLAQKHMVANKEQILSLFQMDDPETKKQMDMLCMLREKGEDDLYTYEDYQGTGKNLAYFCDKELSPKGEVTLIDVGAYQGESIIPVLKFYNERLKRVLAFEPDKDSREHLYNYVQNNQLQDLITIYDCALSNENTTANFSTDQLTSTLADYGDIQVECRRFDDMDHSFVIGDVMIKMDIEGAELGALQGMEKFIIEKQPYLVICLYHQITDILDIPQYLKSLYSGYHFFFRGGWHLECWAVPDRHFLMKERIEEWND